MEFCTGDNCPIKLKCVRYKEVIDFKTEDHLASVPYDFSKKECEFHIDPILWVELEYKIAKNKKTDEEILNNQTGAFCD